MMYFKAQSILEKPSKHELVLVSLDSGEIVSLSGVSRSAWEALDQHPTARKIATVLCDQYDANLETVESDLNDLFSQLAKIGFVIAGENL